MNIIKNTKELKIKKIFDLNGKKTLKRGPFGSALKKSFFVATGFKVYEQKNAIRKNINDGDYYINEKKYQELINFNILPNDIIVSCSGTVGEVYMIPENAPEGVINQALLRIRLSKNDFPLYYYYYFSSSRFKSKLLQDAMGGVIKNISGMEALNNIEVIDISYEEQKKITKILKLQDDKLNSIRKLLEKIEIRNQYYADKLLDGTMTIENNIIVSKNNKNNQKIKITDYIDVINGYPFKSAEMKHEGKYAVIKMSNFKDKKVSILKNNVYTNLLVNKVQLMKNDLLIGLSGSVGEYAIFNLDEICLLNQRCIILRNKNNEIGNYVKTYIISKVIEDLKNNSEGGVIKNVSSNFFENIEILLPSNHKEIVKFLHNINEEKEKVEKLLKLEEQRFEWLSDKLLSGEYIIED